MLCLFILDEMTFTCCCFYNSSRGQLHRNGQNHLSSQRFRALPSTPALPPVHPTVNDVTIHLPGTQAGNLGALLASISCLTAASSQTSSLVSSSSEGHSKLSPSPQSIVIVLLQPLGVSHADLCKSLLFGLPSSFLPLAMHPLYCSQSGLS